MIPPGSTIGILGGGQLGRMLILAGRRLGYRFQVLEPKPGCAAGMVADGEINAPYEAGSALLRLAKTCQVLTFEFENVSAQALGPIEDLLPVRPAASVLSICQNRRREKEFLRRRGFPCAPFRVVHGSDELLQAVRELGNSCVVKTADFGYDGKGQVRITEPDFDEKAVWGRLDGESAVVERWIDFEGEFAVICARGTDGQEAIFPVIENEHRNHILHRSIVPARISPALAVEAGELALEITRAMDVVGLLAVELFLTREGEWLVNEMAPRPHNSGHFSFDACLTNQFEQHLRAICGLPLGSCDLLRPVVMTNLLGDLWEDGGPRWSRLLEEPGLKLHLYDKGEQRSGRKMGHICCLAERLPDALRMSRRAEQLLGLD